MTQNPMPGHLSGENQNSKGYINPNGHCSSIHNSQDMETTIMSIDGEMDKEVWYIYTMEYYSAMKWNGFESVELRWLNPEHVTQSKVRKRKTNVVYYCLYIYIYMESRKMVPMNLSAGQEQRHRHRKQACGHSRGRRRWDKLKKQH